MFIVAKPVYRCLRGLGHSFHNLAKCCYNVKKKLGFEFRFLSAQNFHGECITWLDDCSIFWNLRRTCIEDANSFLVCVNAFKDFFFYDCKATFFLRFPKALDISVLCSLGVTKTSCHRAMTLLPLRIQSNQIFRWAQRKSFHGSVSSLQRDNPRDLERS